MDSQLTLPLDKAAAILEMQRCIRLWWDAGDPASEQQMEAAIQTAVNAVVRECQHG